MKEIAIAMLLHQPTFGFTFNFQDRMPYLVALLDGYSIASVDLAAER